MSNVIRLVNRSPQYALESLNRMTGLEFDCWPDSLIDGAKTERNSSQKTQQESRQKGVLLPFSRQQVL